MREQLTIRLGIGPKGQCRLPLDSVVSQAFAVLGQRGSGKSTTGAVITEALLRAQQQVVVVDPTDVWWGLKSGKDGKSPGLSVPIFGGPHGDLPLRVSDGALLADLVVEERIPCVLSLRHLTKSQQKTFVQAFAERLYHRKGEIRHRTPTFLVIDEASMVVPQRLSPGDGPLLSVIEDIIRRGRTSGLGCMLIDQRTASVNKEVLTQADVLIAHRSTAKQDRAALRSWVEAHDVDDQGDRFLKSLASLKTGQAWVWSPMLELFELVSIDPRSTFDSSRTPKPGDVISAPAAFAPLNIDRLRGRLSAALEEQVAQDPNKLRERIAELEAKLAVAPHTEAGAVAEVVSLRAAMAEAQARQAQSERDLQSTIDQLSSAKAELEATAVEIREKLSHICTLLDLERSRLVAVLAQGPQLGMEPKARAQPAAPHAAPPPGAQHTSVGTTDLSPSDRSGERRMLIALAQHRAKGPMTARRLALLAGMTANSGTFSTYLGRLRKQGLIVGDRDALAITAAGVREAGSVPPMPTGQALRDSWLNELGHGGVRRMLEVLLKHYPRSMDRSTLATASGHADSGTFSTYLGRLSTLGLIEKRPGRQYVAAGDLFE